jgi:antitoxin HicB
MLTYYVTLTPDDNDTLLVLCPTLPEVVTFGDDEADALGYAVGAIEEALAARMAYKEDIPLPQKDETKTLHPVHLSTDFSQEVLLYCSTRGCK